MILPLYTGTENEVLRKVAKPVPQITKKHLKLIKNMKDTLIDEQGLGLAAPQVGINKRFFVPC